MLDERNEQQLIEGLRNNDSKSLAVLYDAYGAIAYGLALRVVGSTQEAEDVVQESFLALWRQADRLDSTRGLRGYLLSIVHHRAIDRIRRRGRRPEASWTSTCPCLRTTKTRPTPPCVMTSVRPSGPPSLRYRTISDVP